MAKTILITGATSGFGEACARRFAQDGEKLVLVARRTRRLEALSDELKYLSQIHTITIDIQKRREVEKSFGNLPENYSHVDVLINNAGLALGMEPAYEADISDWDTMVDTNIKGLMYCTRVLLPGMVARDRGHIINVGSTAGDWPYPGGNVYGGTKAFVKQFSRNLRADLLGKAIRVTNIEPGMAESEFSIVRFKGDEKKAAGVYEGTTALKPEDIAEIIHWAVNVPPHVNINRIEVMPTCQSWGHLAVDRKS
jgi:NADP-dependent 3-hydroxy acid dehydrogenase YdfG